MDLDRRRRAPGGESPELIDSMLDSAPFGHAFFDDELRLWRANRRFLLCLGLSLDTDPGHRLPLGHRELEPVVQEVLSSGAPILDRLLSPSRPGDRQRCFAVNGFPMHRPGEA